MNTKFTDVSTINLIPLKGGIPSLSLQETSKRFSEIFDDKQLLSIFDNGNHDALTKLSSCFDVTAKLADSIKAAASERSHSQSFDDDGGKADILENTILQILDHLSALQIGDFAILPGGWTQRTGAHAILFLIQRDDDIEIGSHYR